MKVKYACPELGANPAALQLSPNPGAYKITYVIASSLSVNFSVYQLLGYVWGLHTYRLPIVLCHSNANAAAQTHSNWRISRIFLGPVFLS